MKYRLEDISREGREEESEQDPSWLDDRFPEEESKSFRFLSPIRVTLNLSRSGRVVLVKSRFYAEVEFCCDRCLERFPMVLKSEYKASFKPKPLVPQDGEPGLKDSPETEFYEGEEIDLSPLIQDQILLAFPPKTVCREECRGLCQRCGQNLNRGICSCADQNIDPRLEALKKIRV